MIVEENSRLKRQIEEVTQQLQECHDFKFVAQELALNDSKITFIEQKRLKPNEINDQIKSKLDEVGIKLNTTLTKTIKSSASEEMVLFAIEALFEALEHSEVNNPGGWLNAAIRNGWIPSEKHFPGQKAERDIFKEWFDLAYKQRLVLAATKGDDGQMRVYTIDGSPILFKKMLIEYPIEQLKLRR